MSQSLPNSDRHKPDIWIVPLSSSDDGGNDGGAMLTGAHYGEGGDDNDDDREPVVHRGISGSTSRGASASSASAQTRNVLLGASTVAFGEESSSPHSVASEENSILSTSATATNNKRIAMQLQQPLSPPSSQRGPTAAPSSNSGLLTEFCCRVVGQSRRLRTRPVAAGCLALVLIGMLQQQQSRHHHHNNVLFHHNHQNVKTQQTSGAESSGTQRAFDVDGPPVPLSGHDTIQTLLEKEKNDAELHHKDRQSNRIGTSNPAKPDYPVIKEDDALLPGSSTRLYTSSSSATSAVGGDGILLPAAPGTLHAAEALLCRKSVVNFVINATDVKDECEGLKKAFDKTCSNSNADLEDSGGSNRHHHRRQERQPQPRRTLAEKTRRKDRAQLFVYRHWVWMQRAYRAVSSYAESLWRFFFEAGTNSCKSGLGFFFSEDAVADAYRDGYTSKLVERDWDELAFHRLLRQWSLQRQNEEQLLYSSYDDYESEDNAGVRWLASGTRRANAAAAQGGAAAETSATVQSPPNETLRSPKQQQQTFPMSLDLPTSNEHVSDKMVSETLLLTQGDKVIEKAHNESVMKKMKQQEAAQDAHTSSKAVADTNAAVAALLNDPSSIEARTCCASILSVYHENCSTDDNEQFSDSKLLLMLFVMAVCGIVKSLIRHYKVLWLPEAAGCILVGGKNIHALIAFVSFAASHGFLTHAHVQNLVLSGYVLMYFPHHDISFDGNWFLRVMVPPIVFEAALSIDKRSFNRHIVPIVIFSVIGTLTATVVTAYVVHKGTTALSRFCTPIPAVEALTFGALISSIDPIAVLSVLSNMGMTDTDTIYVLIFGESVRCLEKVQWCYGSIILLFV
jgi:Sodium/hydrogen exchanger family